MPVQMYEFLLMLDSSKVGGDLEGTKQTLKTMFEKHHAKVLASRPWDERKLAYPVSKQKKALFHLNYIEADTQMVKEIEHDLKLNENVLRFMAVKIEPKLHDAMLALARDPGALALQTANEEVIDEYEMGGRG